MPFLDLIMDTFLLIFFKFQTMQMGFMFVRRGGVRCLLSCASAGIYQLRRTNPDSSLSERSGSISGTPHSLLGILSGNKRLVIKTVGPA